MRFFMSRFTPQLLSLMRIVLAFMFICHGAQKLFGWPAPDPTGTHPLFSLLGVAAILEFVGGLFLLVGLFTRPVAFLLAGEMAVAYFMVHAPQGLLPTLNKGEPAVLYCFAFLFMSGAGAGAWALDNVWGRSLPSLGSAPPLRNVSGAPG